MYMYSAQHPKFIYIYAFVNQLSLFYRGNSSWSLGSMDWLFADMWTGNSLPSEILQER